MIHTEINLEFHHFISDGIFALVLADFRMLSSPLSSCLCPCLLPM